MILEKCGDIRMIKWVFYQESGEKNIIALLPLPKKWRVF